MGARGASVVDLPIAAVDGVRPRRKRVGSKSRAAEEQLREGARGELAFDRNAVHVEASAGLVAAQARILVLEGHRDQWRRLAYALYDELKKHDQAAGDAVFDNYDREQELRASHDLPGAAEERSAIVSYLREWAEERNSGFDLLADAADAIARGDHHDEQA